MTTVAVDTFLAGTPSFALLAADTDAWLTGAPLAVAVALIKTVSVWSAGMLTVQVKADPVMLLAVKVVAAFEPVAPKKARLPGPAGKPSTTVAAVAGASPLLLVISVKGAA